LLGPLRLCFSTPQNFKESNSENYEIVNLEKNSYKKMNLENSPPSSKGNNNFVI